MPQGGHITIAEDDAQEPWAPISAAMLRDERINGNAIRLYAALHICAWRARYRGERGYEGQEALAREFAMSRPTVARALSELVAAGYVETERVGLGEPDDLILHRVPIHT